MFPKYLPNRLPSYGKYSIFTIAKRPILSKTRRLFVIPHSYKLNKIEQQQFHPKEHKQVDNIIFPFPYAIFCSLLLCGIIIILVYVNYRIHSLFLRTNVTGHINCVKFVDRVNRRLFGLFDNQKQFDSFKRELEASEAIISGSFLVQCIINEHWEDSDIDIFVPCKFLMGDGKTFVSPIENWLESNYSSSKSIHKSERESASPTGFYIKQLTEFTKKDYPKIQLIYVDPEQCSPETIINNTDFTILQNIFRVDKGEDILTISNLDDIHSRCITILSNNLRNNKNIIHRLSKYTNRGFNIDKSIVHLLQIMQPINPEPTINSKPWTPVINQKESQQNHHYYY